MQHTNLPSGASSRAASFIIYVGFVLSFFMILFPPFTSMNGRERAFLFSGPEWTHNLGQIASELGIVARIDWAVLVGQLLVVWSIGLGAVWFLKNRRPTSGSRVPAMFAVCLVLGLVSLPASAQSADGDTDGETVGLQGGKFGVGFASSWPSYGLSGTLQVSETITAEVLLGFLGALTNVGGKAWYRFNRNEKYDLYGYGTVSMYRYDYSRFDANLMQIVDDTETVFGFGAGAGVEAGIRKLFGDDELPPIFLNWEIGLGIANFEFYDFSAFVFGGGIHYRFGSR